MSRFNKQPAALPYLFLTEMWERFGFYVVQGLFVLYATEYFGYSDSASYTILGVFSALAYIAPILGGYLANNYLGYKTAVTWGGLFLIVGYTLLALTDTKLLLFPSLATLVIGNGLLKPNISSLLGAQYNKDDPRRDAGFTIFYIGINIGALLAGGSGYIKEYFGWHVSFALAALGLVIGVITFVYGRVYIKTPSQEKQASLKFKIQFILCCLLIILGLSLLFELKWLKLTLLPAIGLFCLLGITYLTWKQNAEYRKKMLILNILILSSIVFWMLMLQLFYSANLFVARLVDKNFFGIHLSTTVFFASESVFIILLGPFFAGLWHSLSERQKNPSPVTKFIGGILFAGFGFVVLTCSTYFLNSNGLVPAVWVFLSYLLITIGELLLSPIGLSAVTMLAPAHLVGLMMGVWFVATGFGSIFAGLLAQLSDIPQSVTVNADKLIIYRWAFFSYALIAFFVGIILFFLNGVLKHYLHRQTVADDSF